MLAGVRINSNEITRLSERGTDVEMVRKPDEESKGCCAFSSPAWWLHQVAVFLQAIDLVTLGGLESRAVEEDMNETHFHDDASHGCKSKVSPFRFRIPSDGFFVNHLDALADAASPSVVSSAPTSSPSTTDTAS